MITKHKKYDVCVIGCGRVGLPLLLAFADKGKSVAAVDTNTSILSTITSNVMPFHEPICQDILAKHDIDTYVPEDIPVASYYILTVGTPVKQHIETDLSAVESAIMNLINKKVLNEKTTIILRSTVAPGTTKYVKDLLIRHNTICNLAMCPERLAEGKAWEELHSLPQIIGTFDHESFVAAQSLFSLLGIWVYQVDTPHEAELAKLFCNIYRYINFAIPNYFLYLMKEFDIKDCNRLFKVITDSYPRMAGLASPGFAAGTCIPGNRVIKVYDENNNITYIEIKELYKLFANSSSTHFIDSFTSDLLNTNIKQIKDVTHRIYSGKMLTFTFSNGKTFKCTEDHLIPIKRNNTLQLVRAKEISEEDEVYFS